MEAQEIKTGHLAEAGVMSGVNLAEQVAIGKATYHFEAFAADGTPLWEEEIHNLVTTAGKTDILDKYFKGSAYTAGWFVGLKGSGTEVVGDTMASHGGWAEVTGYSEATRPALTLGTVTSGSVDNTASKATYSINATVTIAGAFVVNNSTKGGATGTLYSVGNFAVTRTLGSGDSLQITVTLTAA